MASRRAKSIPAFVDDLQAEGRYTFSRSEVAVLDDRSAIAEQAALRRLKTKSRIASLRRGLYVVVPLEYRIAGCPPASWFIDDLMHHLRQPYYVGLLTAAAIHGAAHQQPMAFQVVTDRPTRTVRAGRVRIEFTMSAEVATTPAVEVRTETGTMRLATPEVTAYDLVRFFPAAGYLSNVATVLTELAERIDAAKLVQAAPAYSVPVVQRLGFLLDLGGEGELATPLRAWLDERCTRPVVLRRGKDAGQAPADPRWRVVPNEVVEADL